VHNEEIFCDIYGVGTQNGENDFEKIFFSMKTVTLEVVNIREHLKYSSCEIHCYFLNAIFVEVI